MVMVDSKLDSGFRAGKANSVLAFCKMQALGNDFVVIGEDELEQVLEPFAAQTASAEARSQFLVRLATRICSRNFGVGADGLIVVRPGSNKDTLSWTYLNNDGSTSLMCGNGLRCLALWAEKHKWAPSTNYFVETGKGPVEIEFESEDSISSNLGEPILEPGKIPVSLEEAGDALSFSNDSQIVAAEFKLSQSKKVKITCVNMGNPHCVVFDQNLADEKELQAMATMLQENPFFPEGVNVEFVRVRSPLHMEVIVYERGCGRTLACASGAAAVLVAAVLEGRCQRQATVELEGGSLQIGWTASDNHVQITGPAAFVFEGRIDLHTLGLEADPC